MTPSPRIIHIGLESRPFFFDRKTVSAFALFMKDSEMGSDGWVTGRVMGLGGGGGVGGGQCVLLSAESHSNAVALNAGAAVPLLCVRFADAVSCHKVTD